MGSLMSHRLKAIVSLQPLSLVQSRYVFSIQLKLTELYWNGALGLV